MNTINILIGIFSCAGFILCAAIVIWYMFRSTKKEEKELRKNHDHFLAAMRDIEECEKARERRHERWRRTETEYRTGIYLSMPDEIWSTQSPNSKLTTPTGTAASNSNSTRDSNTKEDK